MRTRIGCVLLGTALALAAGRPAQAGSDKELSALQGTWKLVSLETDGELREFPEKPLRWVIKGNKILYAGAPLAVLRIDPATTPRSMDLGFLKPKRTREGIYVVEGDTLKVCVNRQTEGVKERPLDFATKGKPDWRLLVFQRDKAGADRVEDLPGYVGMAFMAGKELSVTAVLEGGPAQKAGLKKDDILLKVGAVDATDLKTVIRAVQQARPGSELTLRIRRGGEERDLVIKVGVVPFYLLD
jgi:uncharacterized protein (TIGR03067 family)